MLNTQGLQALGQRKLPPAQRAIINEYARYAREDGRGAYPAMNTLAARTGYSARHVRRVVRELEAEGLLVADGWGPKGTRRYAVACPGGDTMSAESSSCKEIKNNLFKNYDSWRTNVRVYPAKPDKRTATEGLHETATARALLAAGVAAGEALKYGWVAEAQAAEVVSLAAKKAARGELRASQGAYILGALRKIEQGERAVYALDVQRGLFAGTWAEYCETLAAVQAAPEPPAPRPVLVKDGLYGEPGEPGPEEWMDIDEVYGVTLGRTSDE